MDNLLDNSHLQPKSEANIKITETSVKSMSEEEFSIFVTENLAAPAHESEELQLKPPEMLAQVYKFITEDLIEMKRIVDHKRSLLRGSEDVALEDHGDELQAQIWKLIESDMKLLLMYSDLPPLKLGSRAGMLADLNPSTPDSGLVPHPDAYSAAQEAKWNRTLDFSEEQSASGSSAANVSPEIEKAGVVGEVFEVWDTLFDELAKELKV